MSVMDGLSYLNRQQIKYLNNKIKDEPESGKAKESFFVDSPEKEIYNPFKTRPFKRNLPPPNIYCGQPFKFNFEKFKEQLLHTQQTGTKKPAFTQGCIF